MKKNIVLFFILCLGVIEIWAQPVKFDIAIRHSKIIDVEHGKIISKKVVLIKNDRISKIVSDADYKKGSAKLEIDATDKFVMPGLWDMHMHFGGGDTLIQENKNLLPLFIANGVTSIRDCAADLSPTVLSWRKDIAEEKLLGPTIYTSGPKLEGYHSIWVGDIEIGTTQELNAALDSLQKLKVDFVKITDNTMPPALYLECLTAAKKRGYAITGHIPAALTLSQVSDAGLTAIEHISYLLRAGTKNEEIFAKKIASGEMNNKEMNLQLLKYFDTIQAMSVYRKLAKNNTSVVPTLSISFATAYLDKDNHANDPYLPYIGKGLRNTYSWRVDRAAKDDATAIAYRHEMIEKSAGLLPLLQKAGIKIIAGTDAGYLNSFDYPGFGLHTELELMVKYGLTPLQALQASIINGPTFFGKQNDYGSISPNKMADILLLSENPLLKISATKKIEGVIVRGKFLNKIMIDNMYMEIKRKVLDENKF